ncbi:MAG: ABC transporter permease subunit [Armatimonadetes bacterium]|nr:ABC transporter permease subunit [Armatimonadota bacterium]
MTARALTAPGRRHGAGNPLLGHELRSRLRLFRKLGHTPLTRRLAAVVLAASYLLLVGLLAFSMVSHDPPDGSSLFAAVAVISLLLICFLAPGCTATAIAGERQKGTWDMLVVTSLSPGEILAGKLWGRVAGLFLWLLGPLPLLVIALLMGRVEPEMVLATAVVLPTTLVGLAAVGLLCSALCRTTGAATATAYAVMLALVLLVPLLQLLVTWHEPVLVYVTCPFASWMALVDDPGYSGMALAWLGPAFYMVLAAGSVAVLRVRFAGLVGDRRGERRDG